MKTLDKVNINKTCRIVGYGQNDRILRRLLELGFTLGQKVRIVSTSLQKKVFLVQIRGYLLSIRSEMLNRIIVD